LIAGAQPRGSAEPPRFTETGPGRLSVRGALTFATARQARELGLRVLAAAAATQLELDCAGVTASDSAGLAVLLDFLAWARHAGRGLRLTELPEEVRAIARISEVDALLESGVPLATAR
jgi:phospholipid transport system transporter-binding protein